MKKRLNNKGYMLVEIILASALAFGLAYFMLELTLKVKEKNDYLLAATLTATDKTIISNKIMQFLKEKGNSSCNELEGIDVMLSDDYVGVNKYAEIGDINLECSDHNSTVHVSVPLKIKNINNNEFNIDLYYLKK